MQIDRIVTAVLLVVIIVALGYIAVLKSDIRALYASIDKAKSAKIIESQNLQQCSRELEALNERIEEQRSSYEDKIKNYETTLKQKPKIRYRTIYKTIIKEQKSDECEDIKSVLDSVRNTPFSRLR